MYLGPAKSEVSESVDAVATMPKAGALFFPRNFDHKLTNQQEKQQTTMAVKFSKSRKVRVFPKVAEAEKHQVWWCDAENQKHHKVCWRTVDLVRDGANLATSNSYCARGLEHWPDDKRRARMERRRMAVLVVMEEQSRQVESGTVDPQRLAKVYEDATLACQFEAHVVGLRDQDDITQQRQHQESRKVKPSTTLSPKKKKKTKRAVINIDGKSTECLRRRSRQSRTSQKGKQ